MLDQPLSGRLLIRLFEITVEAAARHAGFIRQGINGKLGVDIGHGPLSHTTEEVMPHLGELKVSAYENKRTDIELSDSAKNLDRQANHEDYTIKFIEDTTATYDRQRLNNIN